MQEFHDIWEPILQALAEHVNSSTIMKLWFNPLQLAAFSDTTAVIIAESNFVQKLQIFLVAAVDVRNHIGHLCISFASSKAALMASKS